MKGTLGALLCMVHAIGSWAAPTRAGEPDQPPTLYVPKLDGKVQIDGALNEEVWQKAALCAGFALLDGKTPPQQPTEARVLWTDKGLYFGIRCRQPNLPVVEVTRHDADVYRDDSVEVFVDVGCAATRYYHVLVNAANVVRDEINSDDVAWDSQLESGTVRQTDGWSCEIYIPFTSIGVTKPATTPLGLNICRNDVARDQSSSWARLAGGFHQPDAFGLALLAAGPSEIVAQVRRVEAVGETMSHRISVDVRNNGSKRFAGVVKTIRLDQPGNAETQSVEIAPGQTWAGSVHAGFEKPGRYGVLVLVESADTLVAAVRAKVLISYMRHQSFGYPFVMNDVADVWWCENTYKVGRDRPVPKGEGMPVRVEAARNEYEPLQVVVRPKRAVKNLTAALSNLPEGVTAEICSAHYVKVTTPTDAFGAEDWYPDALPPLTSPIDVEANQNQPLWITFYVSPKADAGDHECTLIVTADGKPLATVPIQMHVFGFTLPAETHTETAYGMHVQKEWHGPLTAEQKRQVWRLYLDNLARHRIASYRPTDPAKIGVKIVDADQSKVELDFAEYDRMAAYCYDEAKINSFNFPYDAVPDTMSGHKLGTPDYDRLHRKVQGEIAKHLAQKGWLKKAYAYWIDEPPPKSYPAVKRGMDLLHRNCPGLRTLLTCNHDKAPIPFFFGSIDIWVPVLHMYDHERARERQKLGERVWWYVCCGPRHPYPNNFIDHPAINHRIRCWMMEKYQVDGSLYWSTTYWQHKNPWQDPMSYKPRMEGTWGNGDGYLLYPPVRERSKTPVVAGPVNSIRLALLREGLEDREYFWVLRQRLDGRDHPALHLPDTLVRSLTEFEPDPRKLLAARQKVARAIEEIAGRAAR